MDNPGYTGKGSFDDVIRDVRVDRGQQGDADSEVHHLWSDNDSHRSGDRGGDRRKKDKKHVSRRKEAELQAANGDQERQETTTNNEKVDGGNEQRSNTVHPILKPREIKYKNLMPQRARIHSRSISASSTDSYSSTSYTGSSSDEEDINPRAICNTYNSTY